MSFCVDKKRFKFSVDVSVKARRDRSEFSRTKNDAAYPLVRNLRRSRYLSDPQARGLPNARGGRDCRAIDPTKIEDQ